MIERVEESGTYFCYCLATKRAFPSIFAKWKSGLWIHRLVCTVFTSIRFGRKCMKVWIKAKVNSVGEFLVELFFRPRWFVVFLYRTSTYRSDVRHEAWKSVVC